MGLWERWSGRTIRLTDGEFWRGFFGGETTSGRVVTQKSALALDAVWACTNLIANAVGTLPCNVYSGDEIAKNHPLYELLHNLPNLDDTAPEFWSMVAMCLCLDGNFFAEKKVLSGRLVALNPLPPLDVEVCRSARNERYYEVAEKGKKRKVAESAMLHIRGAVLPGCDRGMSPIGVNRNTLGNVMSAEDTGGRLFAGGFMPAGLMTTDDVLTADQRAQVRGMLREFSGSERAGKVAVLEAGLKYQQLTINPLDAQMLETRQFSVEQVCRIFGVPPVMIGHAANGTTTWGSGIEQLILQFTKTCMRPMLKRIEYALYRDVLDEKTRKTLRIKFNMEELLRGDSAARAEFLSTLVNSGIYKLNEARAYEDKPPADGGDRLLVNGTMTPLDMIGSEPETGVSP